jgi:hypothetical protein
MQMENNIPAPIRNQWKANLDKMKVNQSSSISMEHYNTVRSSISMHFHGRNSKIFTTYKETETHFRVWRLK